MEIKTLNELKSLFSLENPEKIEAVACGISVFELAGYDHLSACEQVLNAVGLTGELEKIYCQIEPGRKTKSQPHEAIYLIINADDMPPGFPGYETAMNNLFFSLEALCKAVESYGFWLLIENPTGKLLLSPLEFRDFIDSLSCPWLGVYLNENNISKDIDVDDYKKILGKRIKATK